MGRAGMAVVCGQLRRLAVFTILLSVPLMPAVWATAASAQEQTPPPEEIGTPPDGAPPADAIADSPAAEPPASDEGPPAAPAPTGTPAPAPATTPAASVAGTSAAPAPIAAPRAHDTAAPAAVGEEPHVPWRDSVVELRNAVGIIGLDPSAELTHDPMYMLALALSPAWWFGDVLYVNARLDLSQELTNADDTTYRNELVVGDLLLGVGASRFYQIPVLDIDVSTDLRITLPTSKVSRARTLLFGLGPRIVLGRKFELGAAGTLTVRYGARFSFLFHSYTTAERETPLIPGCGVQSGGCESQLNTGLRNTHFRLAHGIDVTWDPRDWLELSLSYQHIVDWLYPIDAVDPRLTFQAEPGTDVRFSSLFGLEVAVTPTPMLVVAVGWETLSPQQAPDSTYYNPLFNRYSTLYVDLRLQIEALVDTISDITRGNP